MSLSQDISLEDLLCEKCDYEDLKLALKNLTKDEMELVDFVFFKNNTLQKYASQKSMCYSTAILKKKLTLKKIFNFVSPLLLK